MFEPKSNCPMIEWDLAAMFVLKKRALVGNLENDFIPRLSAAIFFGFLIKKRFRECFSIEMEILSASDCVESGMSDLTWSQSMSHKLGEISEKHSSRLELTKLENFPPCSPRYVHESKNNNSNNLSATFVSTTQHSMS